MSNGKAPSADEARRLGLDRTVGKPNSDANGDEIAEEDLHFNTYVPDMKAIGSSAGTVKSFCLVPSQVPDIDS